MPRLALSLLGPPEVHLEDQAVTGLATTRGRALLAYLATESDRAHPRQVLAALLWPDWPERSARTNLRNVLSTLRTAIGDREAEPPYLLVTRETIQFNRDSDQWVDVDSFSGLIEAEDSAGLEEAVTLYRGPFLEGFSVDDSPAFEDWALVVRERLQRQVMAALQRLTEDCVQRGELERACSYAWRQVELEPWQEEAHRSLMRTLAQSGQRSVALAQYEACRRALREELDVEPGRETTALYEQIRDGTLGPLPSGGLAADQVLRRPAEPLAAPVPPEVEPSPALDGQVFSPAQPAARPAAGVSLEGERRLATVLLADVQGSTQLFERIDTEAWVEIMNQVLQALADEVYRYGGEVDQFRGDGLVAFFGVSATHEDDPERAVLAALAMQEAAQRYAAQLAQERGIELWLRVGVSTGEVIATTIGDQRRHREETAMGEAIALASRIEAAAEPGTVLVTEHTYRLVRPLFEWQPLGEISVRGVSAPLAVYRPLGHKGLAGKGRGIAGLSSPLVGRQREYEALAGAVDRLRAGVGGIVTLVGDAGIGKSRLMAEVREWADGQSTADLQWIEGRCLSYATTVAYHLWLDMLQSLLAVAPDAPAESVRDALQTWVQRLCPACYDDVYPYLGRMLALTLDDESEAMLRGLGAEGLRIGTFGAAETFLESAARMRPLVVVCEDLHWADATSLALLERTLGLTDRVPVLLVCVFRPETEHGCWRVKERAARDYRHRHVDLWLDPLSVEDSVALVGNLLEIEDLPTELRDRILAHAEGNPFFVEEIIRSLIDGGEISLDEDTGRWRATRDVTEIALPPTVHGVIAARIDRLPDETRHVLQLASAIGRAFPYRVLAAIARTSLDALREGEERQMLSAQLLALQRAQLIRERARVPELEYVFKHVLTQEAAYDSLLRRERRRYHRSIAEALERLYPNRVEEQVGLLAHHWERAAEPERAIPYLLRAGDRARVAYANEEATDYYRRALALLGDAPEDGDRKTRRLEALYGLGRVQFGIGEVSEAERCFREAITLGRELGWAPREIVRLYFWLGETLYWQSRHDEQLRLGREGLALLGSDNESVEAARMNQTIAVGQGELGNRQGYCEYTHRTEQFVRRLPYSEELRPAYEHVVDLYLFDEPNLAKAEEWLCCLEERAADHHDLRGLGTAYRLAGEAASLQGDLSRAVARMRQAHETYVRIGDAKHACVCFGNMARYHTSLGDLESAKAYATQRIETAQAIENVHELGYAYLEKGVVCLCQAAWQEALDAIQASRKLWQEIGYTAGEPNVLYCLGLAHLAMGDRQQALERFESVLSIAGPARLGGLQGALLWAFEEAYDDPDAFRAFCHRLQEEHPQLGEAPLVQWYLEPATTGTGYALLQRDDFAHLAPEWTWHDPFGDCSYEVGDGLTVCAANGRGLSALNHSAPSLLRPVPTDDRGVDTGEAGARDWVVQTVCVPPLPDRPAIGGLCWVDGRSNGIALCLGWPGANDVLFAGGWAGQVGAFGRGRLPCGPDGRVFLRLERRGDRVDALCSTDGERWFSVGYAVLPATGATQVGVIAIGLFDRLFRPGAYPDGTAIRFESFTLWQGR